ncbi:MAG: hypothetical protein Fur0044_40050 [Anaerolineae bacterium]
MEVVRVGEGTTVAVGIGEAGVSVGVKVGEAPVVVEEVNKTGVDEAGFVGASVGVGVDGVGVNTGRSVVSTIGVDGGEG